MAMKDPVITIVRGETFSMVVRWMLKDQIVRKAITAISLASGAPRLSVASHGLTDGWPVSPYGVLGMTQINAKNTPPRDDDYHKVTVVDPNTVELSGVTPVDDNGGMWDAYESGGFIQFYAAQDLSGYMARLDIKDKKGGTVWASSEAADAPKDIIVATVDPAAKIVTLTIDEADTAAITAMKGVTDLEMVSPTGVVTKLKLTSSGSDKDPDPVIVTGEITT